MKTLQACAVQMDDIVFEHRNKMYGAYVLRRMYNKNLNRALLLAITIMFAGLAYPLVSVYLAPEPTKFISNESEAEFMKLIKPLDDVPALPPPPPPIIPETKIKFFAPVITIDEVAEGDAFPNQDELGKNGVNAPININIEIPVEKPVEILEVPESKKEIFLIVEEMPSFPGGDEERQRFLADEIEYPVQAAQTGIQGTVYIQFVVDSDGKITDVKILRGIGGGCDEEAIRVVKSMPRWHPGKQNGKTVRVLYNMSVGFRLQG